MTSSKYSSYLDGVPFAINPIFLTNDQKNDPIQLTKAAQDIVDLDLSDSLNILNLKFDFLHELKYLNSDKKQRKKASKASAQLLLKQQQKQQQKQQLQQQIHMNPASFPSNFISTNNLNALNPIQSVTPAPNTNNHLNANQTSISTSKPPYSNSTLLEPTRSALNQSNVIKNANTQLPGQNATTLPQQDSLNELFNPNGIQSLDPFNDMELKTINDLEELKTILQNHQIDSTKSTQVQNVDQVNNNISAIDQMFNLERAKTLSKLTGAQDNFGLPKVSFNDLDINSNKL